VRRTLFLVCLAILPGPAAAQRSTPAAAATTVARTSSKAMLVVAQALVDDTWKPLLDKRVQESPSARALGAAWTPSDPRWQKARASLEARKTTIFDAYAKSPEIGGHIAAEIGRIPAGPDLDAAIAALSGPASGAIVREFAKREFITSTMSATPDGPKIASPEWNKQLGDLSKRFDAALGPSMPAAEGTSAADVQKFEASPAAQVLSRIWMFAVANAKRQMNTALNLMVFDDQAAIDKDIAAAAGPSASAPRTKDSFSLEKMATCQDSWLDWGNDDARVGAFRDGFRAQFKEADSGGYFVPISSATLMSMKVVRVYANSIGMARGFSVSVDAPFDTVKKNVEKTIGKTLKHCETSDGMRTCDLDIAEKRTVTLMADATGREKTTLVGCFYFYEK
jgi:hypothetical protein